MNLLTPIKRNFEGAFGLERITSINNTAIGGVLGERLLSW